MSEDSAFHYSFTAEEAKSLALLFRRQRQGVDRSLDTLRLFVEDCAYRSMTIDEAEVFFRET